jgi:phosphopantetheinyl transferase
MVRRELGDEVAISHDEYGAPQVDTPNIYISISHSRDRVALLISDSPCAVDIEDAARNFRNVSSKYLSAAEQLLAERYDLFAEIWCAKEALYKYHRKGGVDYVEQISILDYDAERQLFKASVCGGEPVVVRLKREDNHSIALIG